MLLEEPIKSVPSYEPMDLWFEFLPPVACVEMGDRAGNEQISGSRLRYLPQRSKYYLITYSVIGELYYRC